MKLTAFEKDLLYHMNAACGVIAVKTSEDQRLFKSLVRIIAHKVDVIKQEQASLYTWTCTQGFVDATNNPLNASCPYHTDALRFVLDPGKFVAGAIICMFGVHHYLKDPFTQQLVKDVDADFSSQQKTLILASPVFEIPPEIESNIYLLEMKRPSQAELQPHLEKIVESAKNKSKAEIPTLTPQAKELILKSAVGLTCNEAEVAFGLSAVQNQGLIDYKVIQAEKIKQLKKTGILEPLACDQTYDHVGGLDNLKDWLSLRKRSFTKEAQDFGLPIPKGILLIGVPGCGKSLAVKAIAQDWGLPILLFDVAKVFAGLVGQSEQNISKVIEVAEAMSPCILFIDELEKAFAGVQSSGQTDSGVTSRVFGKFLTWLQEKQTFVFVAATCNSFKGLPPEFLRKGRFDNIFFVDLPSKEERSDIFKIHLAAKNRKVNKFNIEKLSIKSENLTGAEIEEIINSALFKAFADNKDIDNDYLVREIDDIVPLAITMSEEIKDLRDWAETRTITANRKAVKPVSAIKGKERKLTI